MIKNYIFDIDGTLINTIDMYMPAMTEILEKHGYHTDPADVEQKKHDLFGITGMDALKIAGVADDKLRRQMQQEWFKLAYQREDRIQVFDGIPETLLKLSQSPDIQIAIATSKLRDEYDHHFANLFAFAKLFDIVITSNDTDRHKPDPEPVLAALDQMHAAPETAVYVGDTINDEKAAHAAGVKFAAALYGAATPEKIMDGDFLLHQPTDLLNI